jgi:hypothetical protein
MTGLSLFWAGIRASRKTRRIRGRKTVRNQRLGCGEETGVLSGEGRDVPRGKRILHNPFSRPEVFLELAAIRDKEKGPPA